MKSNFSSVMGGVKVCFAGTSEGAKKAWESRHVGGATEENGNNGKDEHPIFKDREHAEQVKGLLEDMVKSGKAKPANIDRLQKAKEYLGEIPKSVSQEDADKDAETHARAQGAIDSWNRTIVTPLMGKARSATGLEKAKVERKLRDAQSTRDVANDIYKDKSISAKEKEERIKGFLMQERMNYGGKMKLASLLKAVMPFAGTSEGAQKAWEHRKRAVVEPEKVEEAKGATPASKGDILRSIRDTMTKYRREEVKAIDIPMPSPKRDFVDEIPGMPKDTDTFLKHYSEHVGADGKKVIGPNPDRQEKHDEILNHFIEGKEACPSDKEKVAVMMVGGPASGKTAFVKGLDVENNKYLVHVDPDEIKKRLPEYEKGVEGNWKWSATAVHEESSYIAKEVMKEAIKRGSNILFDSTGASYGSYKKKIDELKANGYRIVIVSADLDLDEGMKRAEERANKTGRYVDKDKVIIPAYKNIPKNIPQYNADADDYYTFDTRRNPPVLVAEREKGVETIHDKNFEHYRARKQ